jgi:flagellar motor switch protein FliM
VLEAQYGTSNGRNALKIERMLTNQSQLGWIGDNHVR